MSSKAQEDTIRIHLTAEQRAAIKQTTGKEVDAIELTVEELEARISPKVTFNHNESMLTDDVE